MTIYLRPAGKADLAEIITWLADATALRYWAGPAISYPPQVDSLWTEIEATPDNVFALVEGEQLVGFGQLFTRPYGYHLARLIIAPHKRGQGLGRWLCRQLMAIPTPGKEPCLFSLNVHRHNETAVRLYRSLGFRPGPEQLREDAWLMIAEC